MGWLTGWSYRKQITITGQSGAGTDYQVKLLVGESSGASSFDFHVEGHSMLFPSSKDNSGDLRFTSDDGLTLLSFWVENVSGSSPNRVATIWVKVSADLGSNKNIFCYYGNNSASNVSSGDDTFLFFDDFPGTSLDSNKWAVVYEVGGGYHSVSNSKLTVGSTDYDWSMVGAKSQYSYGHAFEFLASMTEQNNSNIVVVTRSGTTIDYNDMGSIMNDGSQRYVTKSGGAQDTHSRSDNISSMKRLAIAYISGHMKYYIDGSLKYDCTNHVPVNKNLGIQFRNAVNGSKTVVDWVAVRKYVSTEPSFSSASSEESKQVSDLTLDLESVKEVVEGASLSLETQSGGLEDLSVLLHASGVNFEDLTLNLFTLEKEYVHWLGGWSYRKIFKVQGVPGAGTNYQVRIRVGESSSATGYDFHVEGHSANFPAGKNDSGDLRFTRADGETLISFWVEKIEGTTPNRTATIWLKVPDDLGDDVFLYCYYGHDAAWNVSDGESTFEFFDDFDGTTLDATKWTVCIGSNYSISGSVLDISSTSGDWTIIGANNDYPPGHAFEFYAKFTEQNNVQIRADQNASAGQSNNRIAFVNYGNPRVETQEYSASWSTSRTNTFDTTYRRGTIGYLQNTAHFFVDSSLEASHSGSAVPASDLGFQFNVFAPGSEIWVDWVAVRKYKGTTEPSFVSSGVEEGGSSAVLENNLLNLLAGKHTSENLDLDLCATYESLKNLMADLCACEVVLEFLPLWLHASKMTTQDLPVYLKAVMGELDDLPVDLLASDYSLEDLTCCLHITDGVILEDLDLDLYVSDGLVLSNLSLDLRVAAPVPFFKGMYFQRSTNILSEV